MITVVLLLYIDQTKIKIVNMFQVLFKFKLNMIL